MDLLIITGLSGAGRTRAADICEDLNYYCVDNLPAALLPKFAEISLAAGGRYEHTALVMDVRSVRDHDELRAALQALDSLSCTVRVIYLEATQETILRRYKESRRPHPLAGSGESISDALEREAALLAPLRERADLIIDTTGMSLNRLKARIRDLLQPEAPRFTLNVVSFGFKNGAPAEADFVFDVRCLPNPYYEDALRTMTGLDPEVTEYIFRDGTTRSYLDAMVSFVSLALPMFGHDRTELTVAVGCTGGHHRSVAMAQALADHLENNGVSVSIVHRDVEH